MPELRVHYTTVGAPTGEPVVIPHGTTQSGTAMLSPAFAGELFGPGQPLDASKYYIILPDSMGHGKTAKPSDDLRTKFPQFDYDDMVTAQYRLVTEGLGLRHVRLVLGFSMGGMNTWMWGEKYPEFMDALMPMASEPSAMSGSNWMMRRLVIDSIRNDPDWNNGNYTAQPRSAHFSSVFNFIATAGGTLCYQKMAPNREVADKLLAGFLPRHSRPTPTILSISSLLRVTTIPLLTWSASRRRFWRSIRRMTNAIRRKPGSWIANLSA